VIQVDTDRDRRLGCHGQRDGAENLFIDIVESGATGLDEYRNAHLFGGGDDRLDEFDVVDGERAERTPMLLDVEEDAFPAQEHDAAPARVESTSARESSVPTFPGNTT